MESGLKKIKSGFSFYELAEKARKEDRFENYVNILKEGSENNDQECSYRLGLCYYYGHYKVKKDYEKALFLFGKNTNHCKSMARVALMLRQGKGCVRYLDESERIANYIISTNGNYFAKGICHWYFLVKNTDRFNALKRFLKASNKGDDEAQYYVGKGYLFFIGSMVGPKWFLEIENRYLLGFEHLLKSAEQGNINAQTTIAYAYRTLKVEKVNHNYSLEKVLYFVKKAFICSGHIKIFVLRMLNISVENLSIDVLELKINLKLAKYYRHSSNYYLAWYFWKKTKEPANVLNLLENEERVFRGFTGCFKTILTLLCIGKCSRIFPRDIWKMLAKYVWTTKDAKEWGKEL